MASSIVFADQIAETSVMTLGKDLTEEQKNQMRKHFSEPKAREILVTNEEEHQALSQLLPADVIGEKAISSSLVTLKEKGYGIQVETDQITWVSADMYARALTTAGIMDAEVLVAAPFPVSGTAALTGVMKAFETAADVTLSEEQKKTAVEEMVLTAKLADQKGDEEKVLQLLDQLKGKLAEQHGLNEQQMSQLIEQLASQIGLSLTPEEKEAILSLAMKIQNLDINWEEVRVEGERLLEHAKTFLQENPEAKSWVLSFWEQLKKWLDDFFASI